MRHKTIRGAVAGAMLVTSILMAIPANAGTAGPARRTNSTTASALGRLQAWVFSWAGSLLESFGPSGGPGADTKATEETTGSTTVPAEGGGEEIHRSAGIDPQGLN